MNKNIKKVAVASRSFSSNRSLRDTLLSRYSNVKFNESGKSLADSQLIEFFKGCDAAIVALEKIDDSIVGQLPELKVISKYGVGLDNITLEALFNRGIKLAWTGGVNKRSVAELTLFMIIGTMHQAFFANYAVRSNNWHQVIGHTLSEKIVGIVGLGHVGQELVQLLKPFNCRILATDIVDKSSFATTHNLEIVTLDELLANSDVVSVHVPFSEKTRNLVSASQFNKMKKGAAFINTSRGNIVDESAILNALDSRHLSCAAFDVFAIEPLTDQKLIDNPYLYCTPHIGGSAEEAIKAMGMAAIDGLDNPKDAIGSNFI